MSQPEFSSEHKNDGLSSVEGRRAQARDEKIADNFQAHVAGILPDSIRTRDADWIGVCDDAERRQRDKEQKAIRRVTEGGIIRRMARYVVGRTTNNL